MLQNPHLDNLHFFRHKTLTNKSHNDHDPSQDEVARTIEIETLLRLGIYPVRKFANHPYLENSILLSPWVNSSLGKNTPKIP